jgi:hypothetical protein
MTCACVINTLKLYERSKFVRPAPLQGFWQSAAQSLPLFQATERDTINDPPLKNGKNHQDRDQDNN